MELSKIAERRCGAGARHVIETRQLAVSDLIRWEHLQAETDCGTIAIDDLRSTFAAPRAPALPAGEREHLAARHLSAVSRP